MVEAEGVEQLMLDGAVVDATLAVQRQRLRPTTAANVGVTATDIQLNENTILFQGLVFGFKRQSLSFAQLFVSGQL